MSAELVKFIGDNLVSKGNKSVPTTDLKDKIIALYFSAHWCPPCRQFTPLLNTTYNNLVKSGKPFEVVFVSSDQDQEGFDEYFGTMDWKAIPYVDEEKRQSLGEHFGIRGIPALYILDKEGKIISKDGRSDVMKSKEQAFDTWAAAAAAQ